MNDFIKIIKERVSIRDYEPNKKISQNQMTSLVAVVNNAPTSINGQYFGVVFIQDPKILAFLARKGRFQESIKNASVFAVFFIENTQLEAMQKKNNKTITANRINLFTTGVVDATIAATQLQDAAVSMGLGTCFIGSVRSYPNILLEKLNLPKGNIPIIGLTIGFKKSQEELKPKMNKVYFEKYDSLSAIKEINNYDIIFSKYHLERTNNKKDVVFSDSVINFYKNNTWDLDWNNLVDDYYFKKNKE